ncbi:carotenoid ester lipase precursor [Russula vinacea]|nr:carotenoid ester lipase precursor [Russula vinacea]
MRIVLPILALFATRRSSPSLVQEQVIPDAVNGFCNIGGAPPEVHLDNATFTGICKDRAARFLGIPYAQPPTGDRRLRLPGPLPPYEGNYDVHKFGPSCPQQRMGLPQGLNSSLEKDVSDIFATLYEKVTLDSEDCLTINVFTPEDATNGSNLPVVVWIFGGGFEIGGTANYDGAVIVTRSITMGEPIIFVSMNYRVSALGFLPGKEVKNAKIGNLGLQDQRLALKWVQKYISSFGGDPSKVTIWGESAGAISVALHMLVNKGDQEGLFRGAVMQSGGPIPVGDIENGQQYYDALVENAGCDNSPDTLECLRSVPYAIFKHAMDLSPNFFAYQGLTLAWLPRVDGVFLTEPPQYAVLRGHVSNVPMITGNCDDEGTLFSLSSLNVTTTAELGQYLHSFMLPTAPKNQVDLLLQYYPDNVAAGSPFDTGFFNNLSSQYKRVAAIQGDIVFHGPRRFLLKYQANKQNSWAFEISWPQYDLRDPKALIFLDVGLIVDDDNYRIDPLEFVANLSLLHPI